MSGHDLTLYYFPGSSCSQKVLFTLIERDIPYKGCIINIHAEEQRADWYLRLNPKGEVPVLQDGNDVIVESDDIIDYLDTKFPNEPTLVPDMNTSVGQEVAEIRQLIRDAPFGFITYGILVNPELCVCEMRVPTVWRDNANKQNIVKKVNDVRTAMDAQMERDPESRKLIQPKYEQLTKFHDVIIDPERVTAVLCELDQTFDKLEEQLAKSKKGASDTGTYWLCGTSLTAADISTAMLLYRTYILGIDERYFSSVKRPLVTDYFRRMRALPTMQKVMDIANTIADVYRNTMEKREAMKTATV